MRKLVLDTETSGLNPENDRIIELACVEMVNESPTGEKYHRYYNPGDIIISNEAEQIHGLNNKFLEKFPTFEKSVQEFLDFIEDSQLIIHNASFDVGFLNNELSLLGKPPLTNPIVDTVALARSVLNTRVANLDYLCRRFKVDLSERGLHGALLDSQLLAEVYLEL